MLFSKFYISVIELEILCQKIGKFIKIKRFIQTNIVEKKLKIKKRDQDSKEKNNFLEKIIF
jgi:hypothetical protein